MHLYLMILPNNVLVDINPDLDLTEKSLQP